MFGVYVWVCLEYLCENTPKCEGITVCLAYICVGMFGIHVRPSREGMFGVCLAYISHVIALFIFVVSHVIALSLFVFSHVIALSLFVVSHVIALSLFVVSHVIALSLFVFSHMVALSIVVISLSLCRDCAMRLCHPVIALSAQTH